MNAACRACGTEFVVPEGRDHPVNTWEGDACYLCHACTLWALQVALDGMTPKQRAFLWQVCILDPRFDQALEWVEKECSHGNEEEDGGLSRC